tara:strand:- start:14 stop:607 length:594 start_codon:yes stop_codon:yes gene_type:complete
MKELATALSKAQSEFTTVPQSGFNPHFKNKFSTFQDHVDAARPILARHGLAISQMPNMMSDGDRFVLTTILMHESGETIVSNQPIFAMKQDAQSMGSAITYAKRYAYGAILGMASGDFEDDGNAATAPSKAAPVAAKTKAPAAKADDWGATNQSIADRVKAAQHVGELMSLYDEVKGQINEDDKALFSQRKTELGKG